MLKSKEKHYLIASISLELKGVIVSNKAIGG